MWEYWSGEVATCPLCPNAVSFDRLQPLLQHLAVSHALIISEAQQVALIPAYLQYWKERLHDGTVTLEDVTFEIVGHDKPVALGGVETNRCRVLSPILPEDRDLRHRLHVRRLKAAIEQQTIERHSFYIRRCLFCSRTIRGNRREFLSHMFEEHGFNPGLPDNLVYVDDLFNYCESLILQHECIFCRRAFENQHVLKLHMRKKKHFRLDGKNHDFDRFYMINYLEEPPLILPNDLGPSDLNCLAPALRRRAAADSEVSSLRSMESESDDDACSLGSSAVSIEHDLTEVVTPCLFCLEVLPSVPACWSHCQRVHAFDVAAVQEALQLDFYGRVRLVNFLRREFSERRCCFCGEGFPSTTALLEHFRQNPTHCALPLQAPFLQDSQYLFPFLEDDPLLYGLDWIEEEQEVSVLSMEKLRPANHTTEDESLLDALEAATLAE